MANRYWVGGTATWDATAGSKWATTSGGAGGAAVPTSVDDVFFDAASGAGVVTLGASPTVCPCKSLNFAGFTGTFVHTAGVEIRIGDATAGAGFVALNLAASMTYTLGNATTSLFRFISTFTGGQTIGFGGKTTGYLTIDAVGGAYQFSNALNAPNGVITVLQGSLDTNSVAITAQRIVITGTLVRTVSLTSSVITLSSGAGGNGVFDATTVTNLTFNAGTSSITASGGNQVFRAGGLTFNDVELRGAGGSLELFGGGLFNNLTLSPSSSSRTSLDTDITVTGTFTARAFGVGNAGFIRSSVLGTPRTITAAVVNIADTSFADIIGAGAAAPFATSQTGDMGGNSGITFDAPKTRYWVGNTGSFSDISKWAATSGGAGGASLPVSQDTVIFDSNSFTSAGRVLTINVECLPTINLTGITNLPTVNFSITNGQLFIYGDLIAPPGILTAIGGTTAVTMAGRNSNHVINVDGYTPTNITVSTVATGVYTLMNNLTLTGTFGETGGVFDANDFNMTALNFSMTVTTPRTIYMGNGIWEARGTGTVFNIQNNAGLTLFAEGSTLYISDTSATGKTISRHVGSILNTILIAGGAGAITFANANTSTTELLKVIAPAILTFNAPATYTINNWDVVGNPGNLIVIQSNGASNYTMTKPSGFVHADYISISRSLAGGGAIYYAGANSVDGGNNTGWIFTAWPVYTQTLGEVVALIQSFGKGNFKLFSDIFSLIDTRANAPQVIKNESMSLVDTRTQLTSKPLLQTLALVDSLSKSGAKSFTQQLTIVQQAVERLRYKQYNETVSLQDVLTTITYYGRIFNETIKTKSYRIFMLNGNNTFWRKKPRPEI